MDRAYRAGKGRGPVADQLLSLEDAERVTVRVDRDDSGPRIVIRGPVELVDLLESELGLGIAPGPPEPAARPPDLPDAEPEPGAA